MKHVSEFLHGVKKVEILNSLCDNGMRILVDDGGERGRTTNLFSHDGTPHGIGLVVEYPHGKDAKVTTEDDVINFFLGLGHAERWKLLGKVFGI